MATYDGNGNEKFSSAGKKLGGRSFADAKKTKKKEPVTGAAPKDIMRPVSKTCKICSSTYRDQIERFLVYGMSQAEVIRHMAQIGEKFNKDSFSNHVRKHMTLGEAAVRRMLEKQAEKNFENIEDVADNLLSNRAMLEVMRQKAFEAILDDSVSIEPETALKIIEKISIDDAKHQQDRIDEMIREMNILTQTMKEIVPESMWSKIAEQFKTNLELDRVKRKRLLGDGT